MFVTTKFEVLKLNNSLSISKFFSNIYSHCTDMLIFNFGYVSNSVLIKFVTSSLYSNNSGKVYTFSNVSTLNSSHNIYYVYLDQVILV